MNTRKLLGHSPCCLILGLAFYFGMDAYRDRTQAEQDTRVAVEGSRLVRMHSPIIGPQNAPVTIVEFFDPACETCRAFYPIVKQIMAQHPDKVRLALRYAPFHHGSDQVVKLIEAARKQGLYTPVLEALLAAQPEWADHAAPNHRSCLRSSRSTPAWIMERARQDMETPEIQAVLAQDIEDLTALQVRQDTNLLRQWTAACRASARSNLARLVAEEVGKVQP
jgi:protein-disulfide isomerase